MEEGDDALDRGDYAEAIDKYRAAYYSLPPKGKSSYLGLLPVQNAMQAFALLFEKEQDSAILEQQIALLTDFLDRVDDPDNTSQLDPSLISELQSTQVDAIQKLAAMNPVVQDCTQCEQPPVELPDDPPEGEPKSPVVPPPPPPIETRRRPNWLGIGLTAGGGLVAGIGGGVLAGWWTIRHEARNYAQLADDQLSMGDARERYLDGQRKKAQAFRIAGGVLIGVGASAVVGGVVTILVKGKSSRKSSETLTVGPRIGPRGAGLIVRRRF